MDLAASFIAAASLIAVIFLSNLFRAAATKKEVGKSSDDHPPPPEPSGAWPIIGHVPIMMIGGNESLVQKFAAIADKCGPVFQLRLGSRQVVIISSWELAKECFSTNDKALAGRPTCEAATHMGYKGAMIGFHTYDAYWRGIRKLTTLQLLSPQRLSSFRHVRVTEVELIVQDLYGLWEKNGRKGVKVDMSDKLGDITFNVITMMVIGKRCFGGLGDDSIGGEALKLRHSIHRFFQLAGAFVPSDTLPWLGWLDIKRYKKQMREVFKDFDSLLSRWVEEHRARKLHCAAAGGSDADDDHQDFMDVLMSTVEASDASDYDRDTVIKATVLAAIQGAYDTSWISNTWAVSLLLNNKDKLRRAQEEIDEEVGKDRNVEESDIPNLPYLQAIVKETLRLYPPAPLFPHQAIEDCFVGGYRIGAGTILMLNLWKMHRDPRTWSDAHKFLPERFLTHHAHVDARGTHFHYLPFGAGRRMCPGVNMAFHILHLTLARLLHGFDLRTPDDGPVDMTQGTGLTVPKATPLQVVLSPRLPLHLYK